tara:strand:+ start:756 stop:1499 length:744 start_codon:yes stop_codon:yes gene_type:complete
MGAFALAWWGFAIGAFSQGDSGVGAGLAILAIATTAVVAWYFYFVWKIRHEPVVELLGNGFTVGSDSEVTPWDQLEAVGIKWVGRGKICLKGWFRYRDGDDIKTVKLGSIMHSRRSMEELSMLLLTLAEPIVTSQANEDDGGEIEGLRYGRSGFECEGHGLVALEDVNGGLRCIEFVDRINSVDVLVRKKSSVVQTLNSESATHIGAITPDHRIKLRLDSGEAFPHLRRIEKLLDAPIARLYRLPRG